MNYPENCVDVDATGRSRFVQLEPLVQGEVGVGEQTGQRNGETAQCLHTVSILHLFIPTLAMVKIKPEYQNKSHQVT